MPIPMLPSSPLPCTVTLQEPWWPASNAVIIPTIVPKMAALGQHPAAQKAGFSHSQIRIYGVEAYIEP
jgi:hypothetical protein